MKILTEQKLTIKEAKKSHKNTIGEVNTMLKLTEDKIRTKFTGYVLHFKTKEAKALFDNELVGQISDGMYENSSNEDTCTFWASAETVADGTNQITKDGKTITALPYRVKDSFTFNGLFSIVGDRMLSYIKATKLDLDPRAVAKFERFRDDIKSENFDEIQSSIPSHVEKYISILYNKFKTTTAIKEVLDSVQVTKSDYTLALRDVRQTLKSTRANSQLKESTMIISKGSSINADTIEITILDGEKTLFNKKYAYGYNVSYIQFKDADPKKPFIGDLIEDLKNTYGVTEVQEQEGVNVFQQLGLKEEIKPNNKYCTKFTLGDKVRFLHAGNRASPEVATISGYDEDGFYTLRWSDGEESKGVHDANITKEGSYEHLDEEVIKRKGPVVMNKTLSSKSQIDVQVRKWFDRVNGNAYHTVKISIENNGVYDTLKTEGIVPGYGDQYQQTAREMLDKAGYKVNAQTVLNYNVTDNCTKREALALVIKEGSTQGFTTVPDAEDDNHKRWTYKGFTIKWDKDDGVWLVFNKDGEIEWDAGNRNEAKDFIDSY